LRLAVFARILTPRGIGTARGGAEKVGPHVVGMSRADRNRPIST
jgi:hypothetical protein